MSYLIHLTEEALQEEAEAYRYYEKQSKGLGDRFLNEVETTLQKIAENPAYDSFIDETKTIRDIALKIFPFVIIFEAKIDRVEVYIMYIIQRKNQNDLTTTSTYPSHFTGHP